MYVLTFTSGVGNSRRRVEIMLSSEYSFAPKFTLDEQNRPGDRHMHVYRMAFGSLTDGVNTCSTFYNSVPLSWHTDGIDVLQIREDDGMLLATWHDCIMTVAKRMYNGIPHYFFEIETQRVKS